MNRKHIGSVGADDDSFCSIEINVDLSDSGQRRKYVMELVDNPKEYADENPFMTDVVSHEPINIYLNWEGNCCGDVGVWISQQQARALAILLLQASQEQPMAHYGSFTHE